MMAGAIVIPSVRLVSGHAPSASVAVTSPTNNKTAGPASPAEACTETGVTLAYVISSGP